jgi:DUF3047 family protein
MWSSSAPRCVRSASERSSNHRPVSARWLPRPDLIARIAAAVVALASLAWSAVGSVVTEDWTRQPLGAHGVPAAWRPYETIGGHPAYDMTVVEVDGRRALHLKSNGDHSTVAKDVTVDLRETPVLEWEWKVVTLPAGADVRRKETSDLTAHLYVVWPRFPGPVRSRLIGYAWDTTAPLGIQRSQKTSRVTFVILHSGSAETGRWFTERRNVADDYRRIFGEEPENPGAIALSIDTNDTRSFTEAYVGRLAFTSP